MSNITKVSFVLGAIGGFCVALIYNWNLVRDFITLPWTKTPELHYQLLILGMILISTGFFGLWRKSGTVIPLVSAICIIVWDIMVPLVIYLLGFPDPNPDWYMINILVGWIVISLGWITAGISAWRLREEFSQFSIVAALVFLACGVASAPLHLTVGWHPWVTLLWAATGIVAGIYFLDAART